MMTQTEICNKALAHLTEAPISDFFEDSVPAEKCRNHWDSERRALLRMHRWNFAKETASLVATDPAPAFGWSYRYDMPETCLRVLSVNGVEADRDDADFEIRGRSIVSDDYGLDIVFTKDIDDTALFDSLFDLALALKLAAAMCIEFTASQQKKESIMALFREQMNEAGWVDAVEDRNRVIPATFGSRTIAARYGRISKSSSY